MVTASSYQYNDGLIRAENISNTERPSTAVPQFMSVRRSQESSVVVTEALRSLGLYCETCIPLSQDLAMLSDSKGKSIDELKSVIALDINLGQLCRTADAGCQFCSFLMLRLPTKSSRMRQIFIAGFGAPSMMNDIACCSKSPSDNKTNAFLDRLAELRSLLAEQPDASFQFIVEPIQSPTDHSRFDKIKIVHVGSSQMGEKLIKSGKTVTVELYALEGMTIPYTLVWRF
jgi:hypothetical protein